MRCSGLLNETRKSSRRPLRDVANLMGTLNDPPMHLTNRKRGDRISVAIDNVSDWVLLQVGLAF